MPNKDYSNTGIFEKNTKSAEKNTELKAMYTAFYTHITSKRFGSEGFNAENYNGIQLLTCFDSYVEADKKIMILGQEANTDEGNIDSLSISDNPAVTGDEYNLSEEEIRKLLRIDGYKSGIKILFAYHPSARLKEARTVYNKRIEGFLK